MFEKGKDQFDREELLEKDWMLEMLEQFDHPSTALWRAVEATHIHCSLSKSPWGVPVIDLGCGEGKLSLVIFGKGRMNVGLDISKGDLAKAKKKGVYDTLIVGDARAIPFREGSFSGVFSNCVIEHIPKVEKVLAEISRILKEDGVFLFTVPSEQFSEYLFLHSVLKKMRLRKLAFWYSERRNELLSHHNCFDSVTWMGKVEEVGLSMLGFRYYLSKSTVQIWDFLAICIFIMRKAGIFKTSIYRFLSTKSKKVRIRIFMKILYKYYVDNCEVGGGLLFVAKK